MGVTCFGHTNTKISYLELDTLLLPSTLLSLCPACSTLLDPSLSVGSLPVMLTSLKVMFLSLRDLWTSGDSEFLENPVFLMVAFPGPGTQWAPRQLQPSWQG